MNKIRIPDKLIPKIQNAITEMVTVGYGDLGLFAIPALTNDILSIESLAIPSFLSCVSPEGLSEFELFQLKATLAKAAGDILIKQVSLGDMVGLTVSPQLPSTTQEW